MANRQGREACRDQGHNAILGWRANIVYYVKLSPPPPFFFLRKSQVSTLSGDDDGDKDDKCNHGNISFVPVSKLFGRLIS